MLKSNQIAGGLLLLGLCAGFAVAGAPGPDSAVELTTAAETVDAAADPDTNEQPSPAMKKMPELAGFRAEYEVSYLAFSADANLHLQRLNDAGEYRYEVVTKARGLAKLVRSGTGIERSVFKLTSEGFVPQTYHLDDGTDKVENDTDIEFDWDNNIARSIYVGEPKEVPVYPGVLDRLTADIAVIYGLRNGTEPNAQNIADGEEIDLIEFTPSGREKITVPAGTFETVKYLRQRPGSSRAVMIWYAVEADYLPAKIVHLKRGKTNITMVATRLQPGPG